jgi:hypothetical protein
LLKVDGCIKDIDGKGYKPAGETPKTVRQPNLSKPMGVPEGRLGGPPFSPNVTISVCQAGIPS